MRLSCALGSCRRMLRLSLVIGLCFMLLSGPALALVPLNSNTYSVYSSEDIGPWLDAWLPAALARYHVPGVALALVRAGQVLALKGYSEADLVARKPVDAAQTAFQAAAISRLLVALSVLQFEGQSKLDLHADINRYLRDLPLPASSAEPLTLAHLLTQSAGFAPRTIGTTLRQASDIPSLQTALAASAGDGADGVVVRKVHPAITLPSDPCGWQPAGHIAHCGWSDGGCQPVAAGCRFGIWPAVWQRPSVWCIIDSADRAGFIGCGRCGQHRADSVGQPAQPALAATARAVMVPPGWQLLSRGDNCRSGLCSPDSHILEFH